MAPTLSRVGAFFVVSGEHRHVGAAQREVATHTAGAAGYPVEHQTDRVPSSGAAARCSWIQGRIVSASHPGDCPSR